MGETLLELEEIRKGLMTTLAKLEEMITETRKSEHCMESDCQIKVVMKMVSDVRMEVKNLQKSWKKEVDLKNSIDEDGIADNDDTFNPELEELNATRPEMRIYPKIPLPHSHPLWDRVVRVGRRDRLVQRLLNWEGQFTGVEEEEEKMAWRSQLNLNEVDGTNREDFLDIWKEYDMVDGSKNIGLSSPDDVKSRGCYEKELSGSSQERYSASHVHPDAAGVKVDNEDLAHLKTFFSMDKIADSNDFTSCSREMTNVKSDDESSESEEEVVTRIRSRVDPVMMERIKAIVVQNMKDHGKSSTASDADTAKSCVSKNTNLFEERLEKRIFSPEMNHCELQKKRIPVLSNDKKMVTVRAKLGPLGKSY